MYNKKMTLSQSHFAAAQRGSALFMILLAVGLFAALSFAISQQNDSVKGLSSEKIKLLASDVFDMGNKMVDVVAQIRLHGVKINQISFANANVAGYTNPSCTTDSCKVFAYDGGGRDWETPTPDISSGADWIYTGDVSIENIGTTEGDLIAILPNISLSVCTQINKMLGITGPPPQFNTVTIDKYTGGFAVAPTNLSDAMIDGQPSACVRLMSPGGTGIDVSLPAQFYAYYQVLIPR